MGFETFALISLFYAVIGVGVVTRIVRQRREMFDLTFTPDDRRLVTEAAFFILLPISVALHELGHAIAVWSFGGEVVDFGFYVFAGFVGHRGFYTDPERILIALAGPAVNVILTALALAVVFLRRPPMRAAYNELLLQFAVLSVLNALVLYPLFDVALGLDGDWSQIYFGDVPTLSAAILVGHLGILAAGFFASRHARLRRRLAELTGLPPGSERGLLGDVGQVTRRPVGQSNRSVNLSPAAKTLMEAAQRVSSGWPHPIQRAIQDRDGLTAIALTWMSENTRRTVVARTLPNESVQLWGMVEPGGDADSTNVRRRQIWETPSIPDTDTLTLNLRLAMEDVDAWQ